MQEQKIRTSITREHLLFAGGTLLTTGIADIAMHGGVGGMFLVLAASYGLGRHGATFRKALFPDPEQAEQVTNTVSRVIKADLPSPHPDQSVRAKLWRLGHPKQALATLPEPKEVRQEEERVPPQQVRSQVLPNILFQRAPQEQAEGGEVFDADMDEVGREMFATEDEVARTLPTVPEPHIQVMQDVLLAPKRRMPTLFSQVLTTFTPSLQTIFLGYLQDGTPVSCPAKTLCHMALAGSTGQGKSTLIRLLMAQLCKAGASVLLLNPHYTHYDLEADEDWTPYEPYLVYDPMECRKYEVIEFYLKQVATELLPRRLEKYAHSKPLGKPYFLVIDELPAIVKKVPKASEYLEDILREGRKVGIFLVTAAQDFLVKTIAPQGGGAIRDCFRTAMYVGGDPTTAKVLLDMKAGDVPEDRLGKGTIMLRCSQVKQAALASSPYVDNQALYWLLGPSTYVPSATREDDSYLENLIPTMAIPSAEPPVRTPPMREQVAAYAPIRMTAYAHPTNQLPPELEQAYRAWQDGMSGRDLAKCFKWGHDKGCRVRRQLIERGLITPDGRKI